MLERFWSWLRGHRAARLAPAPALPDDGLLTPDQFTAGVAGSIATGFPDMAVQARDSLALVVQRVGQPELQLNLDNTYRAYRLNPAARAQLIAAYIDGLLGRPDHHFTAAAARERLLPRLMSRQTFRQFRGVLVGSPLSAGLMVTYVIDEADRMTYVGREHLEEWELPVTDLHRIAVENLAAITEPGHLEAVELGAPGHQLFVLSAPDGYAASRLLLAGRLLEWTGPLPGRVLLAAPSRDMLYLWGEGDAMVTAAVERFVRESYQDSPYPVHPHVLVYEGGRLMRHLEPAAEEEETG